MPGLSISFISSIMAKYKLNIDSSSVDVIDSENGVGYHYETGNISTSGVVVIGENKYTPEQLSKIKDGLLTYIRDEVPDVYQSIMARCTGAESQQYKRVKDIARAALPIEAEVAESPEPGEYFIHTPLYEITGDSLTKLEEQLSIVSIATIDDRLSLIVKPKQTA